MSSRWKEIAGVVTATVIACSGALVVLRVSHSPANAGSPSGTSPRLTTVPAAIFTLRGTTFSAPAHADAVPKAAAEATASSLYGEARVLESIDVLVDAPTQAGLHDGMGGAPGLHRDCWVVSLDPGHAGAGDDFSIPGDANYGKPPSSAPGSASFLVVFIDAATGKPIFASMGNLPGLQTP